MSKNRTLTCNWFDKRFIRDLCSPHNTLHQREKPSKWYFAYVNNNDKIYGHHKKKYIYIPKFLIIRNVPTKIIRDVHFHFFLKCQRI